MLLCGINFYSSFFLFCTSISRPESLYYRIYSNARQGFVFKFGTAPNRITLNWTVWSQTMACIAKLSCEISTYLRYYAVYSGSSFPTFWDNLSVPSSKVKNPKEQSMIEVNWHNLLFWGLCPFSNFLKKHDVSKGGCVSIYRWRKWWTT